MIAICGWNSLLYRSPLFSCTASSEMQVVSFYQHGLEMWEIDVLCVDRGVNLLAWSTTKVTSKVFGGVRGKFRCQGCRILLSREEKMSTCLLIALTLPLMTIFQTRHTQHCPSRLVHASQLTSNNGKILWTYPNSTHKIGIRLLEIETT